MKKSYETGQIDYMKAAIYVEHLAKLALWFIAFSFIMPGVLACLFSTIIVVAAFFHPDNSVQIDRVKRPVIWIKRPKNVH